MHSRYGPLLLCLYAPGFFFSLRHFGPLVEIGQKLRSVCRFRKFFDWKKHNDRIDLTFFSVIKKNSVIHRKISKKIQVRARFKFVVMIVAITNVRSICPQLHNYIEFLDKRSSSFKLMLLANWLSSSNLLATAPAW